MFKNLMIITIVMAAVAARSFGQTFEDHRTVLFAERNLSGPRLGVTLIPGQGELVQKLEENNLGATISQFGWHFEWQIRPDGGGPAFVIETVPLLGGVEYGKIIPSVSLVMGVRLPNGIEFGMGPNGLMSAPDEVHTALVLAVGKSFDYSGVSIPINIAYATNPEGNRISLMFGYSISR